MAHVVFVGVDGAELDAGAAEGFAGGEALLGEVGGAGFEVEEDLVFHLGFDAVAMGDGAEPGFEARQAGAHDWASAMSAGVRSRMVPMMSAMRFHFCCSAVSFFRPAGVRV